MKPALPGLAATAALLIPSGAAHAANLVAGVYAVSEYVVSSTDSNGAACGYFAGNTFVFANYRYPGPAKPGAIAREFAEGPAGAYIYKIDYPATPATGATTWSGAFTSQLLPGGPKASGTFSYAFSITDANSYTDSGTIITKISATNSCTTVVHESGIYSGP